MNLAKAQSITAVIAVGNTHNIRIVIDNNIGDKINNYINKYIQWYKKRNNIPIADNSLNSVIADNSVKYILDNPQKFGMEYIKLKRRSI